MKYACLLLLFCSHLVLAQDDEGRFYLQFQQKNNQYQQDENTKEKTVLPQEQSARFFDEASSVQDSKTAFDEAQLTQLIFISINQRDWQSLATYLDQYQQLDEYSEVVVLFAKGVLAKQAKRYADAQAYFSQMLALDADFLRGKLELARLLFDDKQYKQAKQLFNEIKPQLPPQTAQVVDVYLQAIEQRQSSGYASVGMVYNTNINHQQGKSECYQSVMYHGESICTHRRTAESPRQDLGYHYQASISQDIWTTRHHAIYTKGLLYGTAYDTEKSDSQQTLYIGIGYKYQNAKQTLSLLPFYEQYRLASHKLYQGYGFSAEYRYNLTDKMSVNLQQDYQKNHFSDNRVKLFNDGSLLSQYITINQQIGDGTWVFYGLNHHHKNIRDKSSSYRQWGGRLGLYHVFANQSNLTALAHYKKTKHQQSNLFIDEKIANYKEYGLSVQYAMPNYQVAGWHPVLGYKYQKQAANIGWFYDYSAQEVSLKLQKHF
ncbi:surface lipoprotein assembly modifier [Moraxella sp. ZJ142]|uniref:surface lipoprotein assembly modifier n=1 Tax=Moraxella marmotae TaxID=3344520 RepID=UPI0035D47FE9